MSQDAGLELYRRARRLLGRQKRATLPGPTPGTVLYIERALGLFSVRIDYPNSTPFYKPKVWTQYLWLPFVSRPVLLRKLGQEDGLAQRRAMITRPTIFRVGNIERQHVLAGTQRRFASDTEILRLIDQLITLTIARDLNPVI